MKRTYQRSQILYFSDLNAEQQANAINQLDTDLAEESSYVLWNNEPLPLCMFMRTDGGLFDGVYGQTAFSAYFVKINKTNECATVVYGHC